MKSFSKFLTLALTLFCFSAFAQTADEIVDKHLEAIGGKDNLKKIKSVRMTGKIQIQPGMDAPLSIVVVDKEAFRFDLSINGMTMIQVLEKDKGWFTMPFQGKKDPEPMTPDQIKEAADQLDITGDLYDYAAKGNQVELVGVDDMDGTEVFKLKVTKKSGNVVYHFIDKATYLDLKQMQKVKVEDKEMENNTILSDYRKTEAGVLMPFSMESNNGPIKFDKVEINPTIEGDLFKMPTK